MVKLEIKENKKNSNSVIIKVNKMSSSKNIIVIIVKMNIHHVKVNANIREIVIKKVS